jgi:hypothetical protein
MPYLIYCGISQDRLMGYPMDLPGGAGGISHEHPTCVQERIIVHSKQPEIVVKHVSMGAGECKWDIPQIWCQ